MTNDDKIERLIVATKAHLTVADATLVASTMLQHTARFVELYNATPKQLCTDREAAGLLLRICRRILAEPS